MPIGPGRALVTGAAVRLGREIALSLAASGWRVAIHYHSSAEQAERTVADLRDAGAPDAAALQADLCDEGATSGLVARAAEALGGGLTLLVNNASIFEYDTLESATRESWDRHLESNLRAPFRLTQRFAGQAPEAGAGADGRPVARAAVVNMIDQRVWKPTPEFMTYAIAKSALWSFTRTAAQALAPAIRVNGIGPGPTLQGVRQSHRHFAAQRRATLLERGADPSDVCGALGYILSADALTGQMLAVDGGQHLAWRTPDVIGVEN